MLYILYVILLKEIYGIFVVSHFLIKSLYDPALQLSPPAATCHNYGYNLCKSFVSDQIWIQFFDLFSCKIFLKTE